MPDLPRRRADEDVVREPLDDDEVVRDEPVAALHEGESAFALPHARFAEKEGAEAAHLEKDAMERDPRRERLLQEGGEPLDDRARQAVRHEEGNAPLPAVAREDGAWRDPL